MAVEVLRELERLPAFRGRLTMAVFDYSDPLAPTPIPLNETPQMGVGKFGAWPRNCDFTVSFLWSRLGTRLPDSIRRPGSESTYASGTEWELDDAIAAKKDVFLYQRTQPPPFLPDDSDLTKKQAQYAAVQTFIGRFTDVTGAALGGVHQYVDVEQLRPTFHKHMETVVSRYLEVHTRDKIRRRARFLASAGVAVGALTMLGIFWFQTRPQVELRKAAEGCALQEDGHLEVWLDYDVSHHDPHDSVWAYFGGDKPGAHGEPVPLKASFSERSLNVPARVSAKDSWSGWVKLELRGEDRQRRAVSNAVHFDCPEPQIP